MKDPYKVLGVPRSADADTIRKAFKKLARKYHPDINKDPSAEARFKEINTAYGVIGDEEKRKQWDRFGEASTRPGFDPNMFGRGGVNMGGAGGDFGNLDDFFSSLFGEQRHTASRSRRGVDQKVAYTIDFMDVVKGAQHTLRVPRQGGSSDSVSFRVPPGFESGKRLRLKGQGLPPPQGGACGDLHVEITVRPHPILRRDGDDLEMDVPLTILEAMAGTQITVPTPTGNVKVKVPPQVTPGQRLRIKGRGIQKRVPGHLYLILLPTPPKTDQEDVLAAAKRLDEAYLAPVRGKLRL